MAEFLASKVAEATIEATAGAAGRATARNIASLFQGEYDEQQVKELKDDLEALQTVQYNTAFETLRRWFRSLAAKNSEQNMDRLNQVKELSMQAVQIMKDPIDQIRSYKMNIFAVYFRHAYKDIKKASLMRNLFVCLRENAIVSFVWVFSRRIFHELLMRQKIAFQLYHTCDRTLEGHSWWKLLH